MSSSSSTAENRLDQAFGYVPAQEPCIAAMVLFGICAILLAYQSIRYRSAYTVWLPIAAVAELVGFFFRYKEVDDPNTTNIALSEILLLVTPNLLALVNYSTVGRLLRAIQPPKSATTTWLRVPIITDSTGTFIPSRIAAFFVLADIFALVIQSSSAPFLVSSDPSQQKIGEDIIIVGLVWALFFIALFYYITVYIYYSEQYAPTIQQHEHYTTTLKPLFYALAITISFLLVRALYRLIAYAQGSKGYISEHEEFLYIFDTLLMLLCMITYFIYPFGYFMNNLGKNEVQHLNQIAIQQINIK